MPSDILILKPDVTKHRRNMFGYALIGGFVIAFIPYFVFPGSHIPPLIFLLLVLCISAIIYWFLGDDPVDTHLELHQTGLKVFNGDRQAFFYWVNLSRFTLLQVYDDHEESEYGYSHHLIARVVDPNVVNTDREQPVEPQNADLRIPIDKLIAHYRFTNRSEAQQAACSSPENFADTVNRWRDFALNIKTGTVPTPLIKLEEGLGSNPGQELYVKHPG
ncbi:hypothetical protein LP7551_05239 [Roseibium album]|nr:hypothetical protein LP7551_05239 [Roseibium album]